MKFPNGFISYMETYHEVATLIETLLDSREKHIGNDGKAADKIKEQYERYGRFWKMEASREITKAFEQTFTLTEWDGQFLEEVERFTIYFILKKY